MSSALQGWLLFHWTHKYEATLRNRHRKKKNKNTLKCGFENCCQICEWKNLCVTFPEPCWQSVHQTRVKDSTPFHKNVVQPPTETHTNTRKPTRVVFQSLRSNILPLMKPWIHESERSVLNCFCSQDSAVYSDTSVSWTLSLLAPITLHYLNGNLMPPFWRQAELE